MLFDSNLMFQLPGKKKWDSKSLKVECLGSAIKWDSSVWIFYEAIEGSDERNFLDVKHVIKI